MSGSKANPVLKAKSIEVLEGNNAKAGPKISLASSRGSNSEINIEIGCITQEGLYHSNEDRMCSGINLNELIEGYVGVFDGHGGQECASFVSNNLARYLMAHFTKKSDWQAGDYVMKKMFHKIEDDFSAIATEEEDTSGSCATVVIVRGANALVANIGDIKAIAVPHDYDETKKFVILTGDHRADADEEMLRIERAGGSVVEGRIYNLQPSRSFGDLDVKEVVGAGIVIPTPEVRSIRMKVGGFLIVATDGVWDSISDEDVVTFTREALKTHDNDVGSVAEALVQHAADEGSSDDITVSVLLWTQA